MSIRTEKFASTLQQALATILLTDSENPRLRTVTVSAVTVSADLRHARVAVSCPDGPIAERIAELTRSTGFLKRHLSRHMALKYMPELTFVADDGFRADQAIGHFLKGDPREGEDRR